MDLINFPKEKYEIIYVDPPWSVRRGPSWSSSQKSKLLPYPTLSIKEIKEIPIEKISEKNSHLYLWVINKYLKDSFEIIEEWGFKFSSMVTWCKPAHGLGLGGAFVQTTEHLIYARKGSLPIKKRHNETWVMHKRLTHSEKPEIFREIIEKVSKGNKKIELFARRETPGWHVWGNEIEGNLKKC